MRGEEKPYEMPVPSQEDSESQHEQLPQQLQQHQQQQQQQEEQQLQHQHNNNLAIQHRLQHLSPVNPQKLSRQKHHQLMAAATSSSISATATSIVHLPVNPIARSALNNNSPSPSAASTVSNQSTGSSTAAAVTVAVPIMSSVTSPLSSLPHPLDSLLTPAASPEDDSLETWIQTV